MKAKDLFTIILKIFGIYLIKDVLVSIPPVLNNFFQVIGLSPGLAAFSFIVSLLVLGFHFVIVYFLLFKTHYLISKLNLTAGLSEEPMVINMHRSSIYTIAIIVTGLLILVFAIPRLVTHLYSWYQYLDTMKGMYRPQSYDFSRLLTSIAEVIIGLLFLGNQRTIVNYIEYKKREVKNSQ